MASLQRFKFLATQCGVSQSPTHSPRTSPVVLLRRRKTTLRMLLTRTRSSHRDMPQPPRRKASLRDLFVSDQESTGSNAETKAQPDGPRIGPGSPRPGWIGFRTRSSLMRKVWRPVLVGIPE